MAKEAPHAFAPQIRAIHFTIQLGRSCLYYRCNGTGEIRQPKNFDEMLSIASRLANDFDFVRVDLYNIHGRTIFGEMTFAPVAGSLKFEPESWDLILGEKWH
jgi:TupA-like ATPgrasp